MKHFSTLLLAMFAIGASAQSDAVSHRYDENGTINAILSYDFSGDRLVTKVTKSGTLNDSTIVHYEDGMPSWTERYRCDGKTGRPLEYTKWGKTVDALKPMVTPPDSRPRHHMSTHTTLQPISLPTNCA